MFKVKSKPRPHLNLSMQSPRATYRTDSRPSTPTDQMIPSWNQRGCPLAPKRARQVQERPEGLKRTKISFDENKE